VPAGADLLEQKAQRTIKAAQPRALGGGRYLPEPLGSTATASCCATRCARRKGGAAPRSGRQGVRHAHRRAHGAEQETDRSVEAGSAFIEDGYVPPPKGSRPLRRFLAGKYGLYMGDGYIIHGTIFQTPRPAATRRLHPAGRQGSEWCKQVPLGAKVYLY
jgi:hypothetical protein